ncbi:MAG: hypothetical protein HY237_11490 [Acidobacteria bacterium]|nr:hypothetical protein [Acidobacteriota bacterium]
MQTCVKVSKKRELQRGMSLVMVAAGLVVLLGMGVLSIDLISLYVARNEAQRAADAGGLAGAKVFVDSGCVNGGAGACTSFQALATSRARVVAGQNNIAGLAISSLNANCVTATFPSSSAGNPLISVTVQRTTACDSVNPIPTFFAKIFGVTAGNVSAVATAEAYNPSGSATGPTLCIGCLKPMFMANCDHEHTTPQNPVCDGKKAGYIVDPSTGAVLSPGTYPAGIIGQEVTFHSNGHPDPWHLVDLGCGANATTCITQCPATTSTCGSQVTVRDPKASTPEPDAAVNSLIHATRNGNNNGQDTINTTTGPPFRMTGGSNNPNPALRGQTITTSDSLVTVALYQGFDAAPGNTLQIVGYMQMFIKSVDAQYSITAVITGVTGCGNRTGTCGTNTVPGGSASLFPIRLVRTPGT